MQSQSQPQTTTPERQQRHEAVVRLVRRGGIRSQHDLADALRGEGIDVNQATLSRDLRELGVLKGPEGWTLPESIATDELTAACRQWLSGAEAVGNQLVLRTAPGGATPLALALDHAADRHVAGTIAGDDTVLVICRSTRGATTLARALESRLQR